jgi:uncharacterized protein
MHKEKLSHLIETLKGMKSVLLAYSGGADSTLLLKALQLSGIEALAVTAVSEAVPEQDIKDAVRLARKAGIEHIIIKTDELKDERYTENTPERCFYCKDALYLRLKEIASERGLKIIIDGTNADDTGDWRPGIKAARNHGVRSPLDEAGFTKNDVREVSRMSGLSTWRKPSSPCLSSRIPYGIRITADALDMIRRAEEAVRKIGFSELRVRHCGDEARIEVPEAGLKDVLRMREKIVIEFKGIGYKFISLDLEGLRSGSLNRVIEP